MTQSCCHICRRPRESPYAFRGEGHHEEVFRTEPSDGRIIALKPVSILCKDLFIRIRPAPHRWTFSSISIEVRILSASLTYYLPNVAAAMFKFGVSNAVQSECFGTVNSVSELQLGDSD